MLVINDEHIMIVKDETFVYECAGDYVFSDVEITGKVFKENVNRMGNMVVAKPLTRELTPVDIDMVPHEALKRMYVYNSKMRTISARKIDRLRHWYKEAGKYFLISQALSMQDIREAMNRQELGSSRSILGMYYDSAYHKQLTINGTTYYDVITVHSEQSKILLYHKGKGIFVDGTTLVEKFKEIYTEEPNAQIPNTHII